MRYGSVCSGIEAATVAWHPLGWTPAWFAEIDPFCNALLKHHYSEVENYGDFTQIGSGVQRKHACRSDLQRDEHDKSDYGGRQAWSGLPSDYDRTRRDASQEADSIDLLAGGTPCQDFSVAGLRKGLAGARGNLTLEFAALADRLRPRWLVWENVPGVLSIDNGRAFGAFLGILGECGYGFAYRVLDAQYFGVPQRRRRVFVVGYLGDWRRAAAVLFERASLSGHPAPSRKAGEDLARCVATGTNGQRYDWETETFSVAPMHDAADSLYGIEVSTSRTLDVNGLDPNRHQGGMAIALPLGTRVDRGGSHREAEGNNLVFQHKASSSQSMNLSTVSPSLEVGKADGIATLGAMGVRRLTPRECERLQGFQDDYTLIPYRGKPAADGPRYRALGNSMAVPVMRWIGERIQAMEALVGNAPR